MSQPDIQLSSGFNCSVQLDVVKVKNSQRACSPKAEPLLFVAISVQQNGHFGDQLQSDIKGSLISPKNTS